MKGGCDGKREREISQGGMDVRVPQKRLRSISGEGIGGKMVSSTGNPLSVRVIPSTESIVSSYFASFFYLMLNFNYSLLCIQLLTTP